MPTEYKVPATLQRPVRPQREVPAPQTESGQPVNQNVDQSAGTGGEDNPNFTDVLKRQTEITEMLVKQQTLSLLSDREIPIFLGDPLQFNINTFIKAFEQCVERKTSSMDDRLYYLQQYTREQPRSFVSRFLHMDPTVAYNEAKKQLEHKSSQRMAMS